MSNLHQFSFYEIWKRIDYENQNINEKNNLNIDFYLLNKNRKLNNNNYNNRIINFNNNFNIIKMQDELNQWGGDVFGVPIMKRISINDVIFKIKYISLK